VVGTIQSNRKQLLPKKNIPELSTNEAVFYKQFDLMYIFWKDIKHVHLLTSINGNKINENIRLTKEGRKKINIPAIYLIIQII
jgi:hypothetical protein